VSLIWLQRVRPCSGCLPGAVLGGPWTSGTISGEIANSRRGRGHVGRGCLLAWIQGLRRPGPGAPQVSSNIMQLSRRSTMVVVPLAEAAAITLASSGDALFQALAEISTSIGGPVLRATRRKEY